MNIIKIIHSLFIEHSIFSFYSILFHYVFMKKNILFIIGSLNIGGSEKQLLKIINCLQNKFRLHVLLIYEKGDLYDTLKKENVKVFDPLISKSGRMISMLNLIISIFRCALIIRKYKIDLTHSFLPLSYLVMSLSMFLFRKNKFVMSRRSLNYYQKRWFFFKQIEMFLHKRTDLIIANSKAIQNQLCYEENVPKKKVRIIYNSVEKTKNILKKNNTNSNIIIHVANLIPYKNHEMVIKAISQIKNVNFKVLFIGGYADKEYVNKLKKLISCFNLQKIILFKGQVKEVDNYVLDAQIGLLTSNTEGLPNAILEYFFYGLPVVSTDVGGVNEIIENEYNGFLVQKNDFKELAKKIEVLLRSAKIRKKFSINARKSCENKFSSDNLESYR